MQKADLELVIKDKDIRIRQLEEEVARLRLLSFYPQPSVS